MINDWTNVSGLMSAVSDQKIYVLSQKADKLYAYDWNNSENDQEYSTEGLFNSFYNAFRIASLATDQENHLYLQSAKGIYLLDESNGTFTQIVDGALNTMSSGEELSWELYIADNGDLINVRADHELTEWRMYIYTYDETLSAFPEETLTVYSLEELKQVRSSIVQFQLENPNIYVDYQVMNNGGNEKFDYIECIRVLNTQILAGDGPDIICLDGLNVNDMMEKGVLEDITKEVNLYTDIPDVISSIYKKDDKIFAIPTRVQIPVLAGNEEAVEAADTLQGLADYAKQSQNTLFGGVPEYDLIVTLYQVYKNEICNADGSILVDQLENFFKNSKTIYDSSCILEKGTNGNSIYNIKDQAADLGLGKISDLRSIQQLLSLTGYSKTSLKNFAESFIPADVVSVNSGSKKVEDAKAFLNMILSDESQEKDVQEGVSIRKSLVPSKWIDYNPMKRGGICGIPVTNMSNVDQSFLVDFPSKEQIQQYVSVYDQMKTPYRNNINMDDIVLAHLLNYVKGQESLEDAMENLRSKLYLNSVE